jgi:hypothetical protein
MFGGVSIRSGLDEGLLSSLDNRRQAHKQRATTCLCRRPIVVVQHAAQPLPPLYRTARSQVTRLGKNDSIGQPLVISFAMIQLSNATPILGMCVRFTIAGMRGTAVQYGCMRAS